MIPRRQKRWMECRVCRALVYSDDDICCVCHSSLKGNLVEPRPLICTASSGQ